MIVAPLQSEARAMAPGRPRRKGVEPQPLELLNVPGALLKLDTLARLAGRGVSTLYADAAKDPTLLVLTKVTPRCTRVRSEDARAYLARLSGGAS